MLCSWARHLTFRVSLSTQVYKWATGEFNAGDNSAMDKHPIQGGVEMLLLTSRLFALPYHVHLLFRQSKLFTRPYYPVCGL